jgi:hypothetical protein
MGGLSTATWAATISVVPADQTVVGPLGNSFEVTISIGGLANSTAPSLSVYDMTLSYDASILTYGGTVFDSSQMNFGGGSFSQATPGAGSLNLLELSYEAPATLDGLQSDAFDLAVITFYTASYGTSSLNLGSVVLGDALADPLSASIVPGSITVSVVPIPAVFLFPSALVALAWVRRKFSLS